ncbi:F0F1 ATP synthase subunit delta, partial [Acinetobacter baumannii]
MSASAAGSYANALAEVAKSNNTLEQTSADIEKLEKLFTEKPVLQYFTNPTVSDPQKRLLIDDIANSSMVQPHVVNFLNILLDMKRIDLITDIVKEFEVVYNKITETELA